MVIFRVNEKLDGFEIVKEGLLGMQICTSETDIDKINDMVSIQSPPGTTYGRWSVDLSIDPVLCVNNPDKKHYIMTC